MPLWVHSKLKDIVNTYYGLGVPLAAVGGFDPPTTLKQQHPGPLATSIFLFLNMPFLLTAI